MNSLRERLPPPPQGACVLRASGPEFSAKVELATMQPSALIRALPLNLKALHPEP